MTQLDIPYLDLSELKIIRELIQKNEAVVLFSGGKDSLCTLHLINIIAQRLGKDITAVHADTTVGLPCNINYVKDICNLLKVKLVILKPRKNYFELAKKKGFPTMRSRWCCYELKINPIKAYLKTLKRKAIFDGIRKEESRIRAKRNFVEWHSIFKCRVCHPILDWKTHDVLEYIKRHSLPLNPAYILGFLRASECWCGLFKSVKEFKLLKSIYPEFFEKLVLLEASMRNKGSYLYKQGQKVYLRDL
jgi:phosphoadenosine phosphosulfate reductase